MGLEWHLLPNSALYHAEWIRPQTNSAGIKTVSVEYRRGCMGVVEESSTLQRSFRFTQGTLPAKSALHFEGIQDVSNVSLFYSAA
jgi:hypothetical protein